MSSTQTSEDDPFLNENSQVNLDKIDDSSSEGYNKGNNFSGTEMYLPIN